MPTKNPETSRRYRELYKRPKPLSAAERRKILDDSRAAQDAVELVKRCKAHGTIKTGGITK